MFSLGHRSTDAIWQREEPVNKAKPFDIPKREVWEAFKRVKANQGAAGVDGQSIAEFEANLSGNLYKLWNRLSSGSYFPLPVRRVEIPKADGGTRPLDRAPSCGVAGQSWAELGCGSGHVLMPPRCASAGPVDHR